MAANHHVASLLMGIAVTFWSLASLPLTAEASRKCDAPSGVEHASSKGACAEGHTIEANTPCTPNCNLGYDPNPIEIWCLDGAFDETFKCSPSEVLSSSQAGTSHSGESASATSSNKSNNSSIQTRATTKKVKTTKKTSIATTTTTTTTIASTTTTTTSSSTVPRCTPPRIGNASSQPCLEGHDIMFLDLCTTSCHGDFSPSVAYLTCKNGGFDPPTFHCLPPTQDCSAPDDIQNAASPACEEGPVIKDQEACMPKCKYGYGASGKHLQCQMGTLKPTYFTCEKTTSTTTTRVTVPKDWDAPTFAPLHTIEPTPVIRTTLPWFTKTTTTTTTLFSPSVTFMTRGSLPSGVNGVNVSGFINMTVTSPGDLCSVRVNDGLKTAVATAFAQVSGYKTISALNVKRMDVSHCSDGSGAIASRRLSKMRLPLRGLNVPTGIVAANYTVEMPDDASVVALKTGLLGGIATFEGVFASILQSATGTTVHKYTTVTLPMRKCLAPKVRLQADASCKEGQAVESGTNCTTTCVVGYLPTVKVLTCTDGALEPASFKCLKGCKAPIGIEHASAISCLEGATVHSGSTCTPRCLNGYLVSVNAPIADLRCENGELLPPGYSCTRFTRATTTTRSTTRKSTMTTTTTTTTTLHVMLASLGRQSALDQVFPVVLVCSGLAVLVTAGMLLCFPGGCSRSKTTAVRLTREVSAE